MRLGHISGSEHTGRRARRLRHNRVMVARTKKISTVSACRSIAIAADSTRVGLPPLKAGGVILYSLRERRAAGFIVVCALVDMHGGRHALSLRSTVRRLLCGCTLVAAPGGDWRLLVGDHVAAVVHAHCPPTAALAVERRAAVGHTTEVAAKFIRAAVAGSRVRRRELRRVRAALGAHRRRDHVATASSRRRGGGRGAGQGERRHEKTTSCVISRLPRKPKDLRLQVRNEEKPARRAAAPASLHLDA